jgi:Carboxypeptidase regulatory-like domain/TonB dependent receptor/TonB-dependent Receptor Plug Domain
MRERVRLVLAAFVVVLAMAANASAQTTTGTISGRVVDVQGAALPGATVTATSPNLQGTREAVTSANGDYILTGLPSGPYMIAFSLSGFQTQTKNVVLAPTQVLPLEATLGPAGITEQVDVVASTADTLLNTAQIATNFSQELISSLPTSRDLNSILLMAPGVHPTGPAGAFSFGGSVSFENLFLLNGVSINENIRGQAFDMAIEDAIQETTVANGGVSAEFGRFSGGVVNIITKSGGNRFSGSFRQSLNNDNWRTLTPFETARLATTPEPRIDDVVPTYEYTLGGPVLRDRLWFFTSGRLRDEAQSRTLFGTNVPYQYREEQRRYEGKGTYSLTSSHRFQFNYNHHDRSQVNNSFNQNVTMDLRSLGTRRLPERLYGFTYTGTLTPRLFVEALVSRRTLQFIGSGAKSTDLIEGTLLVDNSRGGGRWWSDTFCGVCTPEGRDSEEVFVKASYFMSTPRFGSHNLVFGYDTFNDIRTANNHQSGSDYRILSAGAIFSGNGAGESDLFPIFLGDGTTTIQWNPILQDSEGSSFRTHSGFINDTWRLTDRLTANIGIRFDKNDGADQSGNVVAKDSAWSPRLGVVWDPSGTGSWSVTASVAKYVAAISNPVADSSAAGGNPQQRQFIYRGASINGPGTSTLTATPQAIRAVFDWFFANGGPTLPLSTAPTIPGVTPQIANGLASPSAWEYASGVSRTFGGRASLRADLLVRHYVNFYMRQADTTTGHVQDPTGRSFDLSLITNAPDGLLSRDYAGGTFTGTYRFGRILDVGANYTLSRAWGNFDAETVASGPVPFDYRYPEYKQESWNFPEGDLAVDQRHRARLWLNYNPSFAPGLTVSVLQALESGVPYGATNANGVDVRPFVTNPNNVYLTPPGSTATSYFFTARDEFHTEGQRRTDLALNYTRQVPGAGRAQLFAQVQVLNLFNQFQLCACGSTIFGTGSAANAGGVNTQRIDTTVLTPGTTAAQYATFNPFTTTPVRGVNWDYGPNFGTAANRFAYTTPRTFRMSFGVRF